LGYANQAKAIERLTKEAQSMLRASEDRYVEELLKRYQEFARDITAKMKALHGDILHAPTSYGEAMAQKQVTYSRYLSLRGDVQAIEALKDEVTRLGRDVNDITTKGLIDQYKNSYNMTAYQLDYTSPANIEINYRMAPEPIIRQFVSAPWNGAMFSQRIGVITTAMAQDIQQEVTSSMLAGDSAQDLAKRIKNVIGDGEDGASYRAKMIARTELLRSANIAKRDMFEQNEDIIDTWIWQSRNASNSRLCDECASLEGLTKEEVRKAGYDPETEPPLHPHCACLWMPKMKSWKELLGPKLSKGMPDLDKYDMASPVDPMYKKAAETSRMTYSEYAKEYLFGNERGSL
jgi:SPP1 gp7 family putative phage head morphogenesis protein